MVNLGVEGVSTSTVYTVKNTETWKTGYDDCGAATRKTIQRSGCGMVIKAFVKGIWITDSLFRSR